MFVQNKEFLPIVRDQLRQGHTVTLPTRGYSMRPFLEHDRDSVTLEYTETVNVGDAILAEVKPGVYVLHRVVDVAEVITLQGDGNYRSTEQCTKDNVLGVVIQYVYPDKTVSANNKWLQWRIKWWMRLRFARRWLLIIYKIVNHKPMHL